MAFYEGVGPKGPLSFTFPKIESDYGPAFPSSLSHPYKLLILAASSCLRDKTDFDILVNLDL